MRKLLRKERAISRHAVCTAHWGSRIALRNKMGEFLARALRLLHKGAPAIGERRSLLIRDLRPSLAIGERPARVSGALATGWMRRFANCYRMRRNVRAAVRTMLPVALRNFLIDYIRARDIETAHATLHLSPPGRRSTTFPRPLPEPSPDEQRGAKRATKKPKGGGSRGRR